MNQIPVTLALRVLERFFKEPQPTISLLDVLKMSSLPSSSDEACGNQTDQFK